MNDTAAIDPAAIVRNFADKLAFLSVNSPKAGGLLYLLPPCLVLIAIDVSTRLARRPKIAIENAEAAAKEEEVEELVRRVQNALTKFRALEKRLSAERARSQYLARMLRKQQNIMLHRQRLSTLNSPTEEESDAPTEKALSPPPSPEIYVRVPFYAFLERLVLQNRIWAQQREVKELSERLMTMKQAKRGDAFHTFCERLLLSNKLWAQQQAVSELVQEAKKLTRSRQLVVSRAAEKMAMDVEKERLTEEFVKDLLAEVEECQQALINLRIDHEKEIQELAQDWREESRRLSREVKRLELSRDAHLMEQNLSNEHESELIERLSFEEDNTLVLNVINEASEDQFLEEVPEETQDMETYSESELERMSNTSTSTCVASAGVHTPARKNSFSETPSRSRTKSLNKQVPVPLPPLKLIGRRRSMSIILSPSATSARNSPVRRFEAGPYAGFSFNPLFFGNTTSASSGEPSYDSSPSRTRTRTQSLRSTTPHDRMRTYSLQSDRGASTSYNKLNGGIREPPRRAQWRL